MSRLFKPTRQNIYNVDGELDMLIQSFRQRFELPSDSEGAGYALVRLADEDTTDREIDCVVRLYMRRLHMTREEAIGQLAVNLTMRAQAISYTPDCYCCPGEETGRLFEDGL